MRASLLVTCCLLATSGLARAESGWNESFTPESVASYVGAEISLLVVPAGEANDERAAATEAFVQALRSSKRLKSLLTSESLGELGQLEDAAIVKKGAHLPVNQIAIVRVMAGGEGDQPTAVVSFYGKDAEAVTALSVQKGTVLAAASTPSTPDAGASADAMVAVGGLQKKIAKPRKEAREEFEKNVIWFADYAGVNQAGAVVASWSVPYRGKYKEPLNGADFYTAVGREDLAASYSSKNTVRTVLLGGGMLGMLGGLGVAGIPIFTDDHDSLGTYMIAGGAIAGAGLVAMFVGALLNPHPVSPSEARQLADDHNKRLRERLGLTEEARRTEDESKLKLGIALTPGGGAVSAGFAF